MPKQTIKEYLQLLQLTNKQMKKLNKYRLECNLTEFHERNTNKLERRMR